MHKIKSIEFVKENLEKKNLSIVEDSLKIEKEFETQNKHIEYCQKRFEEYMRECDIFNKTKIQVHILYRKKAM